MSQSVQSGQAQVELRQPTWSVLQLPILIAVCLVAVVLRVEGDQTTVTYIICAAGAVLNVLLTIYLLNNTRGRLVVTPNDIMFSRELRPNAKKAAPQQVIHRVDGSTLSFRVASNGPVGSTYTGYILKLRDNATGHEVYAGAFGQRKVQQACESQGWSFRDP